jgi:hypothetical protein
MTKSRTVYDLLMSQPASGRSEKPNPSHKAKANLLAGSLSQMLSVSRAEMQRRLAAAPAEKTSKHERYKIVPVANPPKP